VTVYQEQVMLLSMKLAGFNRGDADNLRKAIGKKDEVKMAQSRQRFIEGCRQNGHSTEISEKIWHDWESFARYAFNKSHSTGYSWVSYQTAYLKAHFPAEFMAAVLSRNLADIKKITTFMDECKSMGLKVLGPDVNESNIHFSVNRKGDIRFGLGAIKGVGENAAQNIIEEREKNGPYQDIFDFATRINLLTVNKKSLESLAMAGALDNLDKIERHRYFAVYEGTNSTFIETLIRYGNKVQSEKSTRQISLFGDQSDFAIQHPNIPDGLPWTNIQKLNKEKEFIGIYLSAHPLDQFKVEFRAFTTHKLSDLSNPEPLKGKKISIGGIVNNVKQAVTSKGTPYGTMDLEDFTGSFSFSLFGKNYLEYSKYFVTGYSLLVRGSFQPRQFGDSNQLEFRVERIEMLSDLKDKINNVMIILDIDRINTEFITDIQSLAEKNRGKVRMTFQIRDLTEHIKVEMFSRKFTISLNDEIIDYLENSEEIEYHLS
jgi:DNA polymerase-3 subunit alpha